MKVLILAPYFNPAGTGEDYSTYKWINGIAAHHDVTVLCIRRGDTAPDRFDAPLTVVEFPEPKWNRWARDHSRIYKSLWQQLKQDYIAYYWNAKRWMRASRAHFDLIHQMGPLAPRYPCPLADHARRSGTPLILGPLAGSLSIPRGFGGSVFGTLTRIIDRVRLRCDPWLKSSLRTANTVIVAAPYMEELLRPSGASRFFVQSETGTDITHERADRLDATGRMRLLFVGRLIRRKGILEVIRAVGSIRDLPLTLDIVGEGSLATACAELAKQCGIEDRVVLHGFVSKARVAELYEAADVFVFPSVAEPSGNVVMESMSYGLPVIVANRGGPGYVVTDECGIRVRTEDPARVVSDTAAAIRFYASDRARMYRMGQEGRRRIEAMGLWPKKIERLMKLYAEVAGGRDLAITDGSSRFPGRYGTTSSTADPSP